VRIGTSPWDLGERVYADLRNLTTPRSIIRFEDDQSPNDSGDIQQYFVHANLDQLRPGRTYYYFVGHDGWDVKGNVTSVRSFTTAESGREPFTFTAFGDQGISYDAVATTGLIRAQKPGVPPARRRHLLRRERRRWQHHRQLRPAGLGLLLHQVEPVASGIPWQVAMGNHEIETWYSPDGYGGQFDRFAFPQSTSSTRSPMATSPC